MMSLFRCVLLFWVLCLAHATWFFPEPGPETENDPNARPFACHVGNRIRAEACDVVTLPSGFCADCGVTGVLQGDGKYADCTSVSWSLENDNGECISKFAEYNTLNPCDPEREVALETYLNPTASKKEKENARQQLDFLMYSLCENVCDCVPQRGVDPNIKAYDVTRGSCQGHARGELCNSYPNIKLIRGVDDPPDDVTGLPPVCPMMQEWFDNLTETPLSIRTGAFVEPAVEVFLERMLMAAQILEDNTVWEECLYFESQGAVRLDPALETVYPNINCRPVSTSGCPDPFQEVVMHRGVLISRLERCVPHQLVDFFRDVLGFRCRS